MKKIVSIIVILFFVADIFAQCPMCKMTAESNMEAGGTMGNGLNAGILYMLVAPYLIVAGIAIWWWRNRKSDAELESTEEWLRPSDDAASWN
jgi:hypothetical protein